jgi:pilus assembly protein CpaE
MVNSINTQDKTVNTLVFVLDTETETLMRSFDWGQFGLEAEIHRGGIEDIIDFMLKKKVFTPSIIILDISDSNLPVSDMQRLADVCDPTVKVFAIGERNEVGLFRSLIELGVRDYIAKPITDALLSRSLGKLLGREDTDSGMFKFSGPGQAIGFIGARGGVGVSTFAANCAWVVAQVYKKKTCLVDLDLNYSGAAQFFDQPLKPGLREMFESPERIDELFIERCLVPVGDYLSLIGGDEPVDQFINIKGASIEEITKVLRSKFQYGFYDIPRHILPFITENLEKQLNKIILICDPTILSVRDTVRLLNILKKNQSQKQRILLVLNLCGLYNEGEIDQVAFEEAIQFKVDYVVNFDIKSPLQALNEGIPVASFGGDLAERQKEFAEILLGKESVRAKANTVGFFKRIFKGSL